MKQQSQPIGSDLNVSHFHHTYWALLNIQLIFFTWRLIINRKATQAEASEFGKSVPLALTAILVYFQAVYENWEASVKISLSKTNTSVQNRLSVLAEQGGMRWAELLSDLVPYYPTHRAVHSSPLSRDQLPAKADLGLFYTGSVTKTSVNSQFKSCCPTSFVLEVGFVAAEAKSCLEIEVWRPSRTVSPFINP